MLTKEQFYRLKIFFKVSIPSLRSKFRDQVADIDRWYCNEEYNEIQKLKSFIEQKFKAALEIDQIVVNVTDQFVFDLYNWWMNVNPVCHYCGLPEAVLNQLHEQQDHINKRWPKRGQSLELDRKQCDLSYSRIDNLALACYWCNNAKTDTFTYEEFREIGAGINRVWTARFGTAFPIPEI